MAATRPTTFGLLLGVLALVVSSIGIAIWFALGLQNSLTLGVLISTLIISTITVFMSIWRRSEQEQGS